MARIDLVRGGDKTALAAALDEYRSRLEKTVRFRLDPRLVGRVGPDDVLQEAYINAAQRCAHVEGNSEQSLFIWLRLIVLQTLVDVHRRYLGAAKRDAGREVALRPRSPLTSTTMSLAQCLVTSMTSPSRAFGRAELSQQLQAALDKMDAIDREVLALRHFEEFANHEIAEVLGIEQKAASIRYVRALRRLKAILSETSMT
jgi:RNA polymerase sigma-70 factor, ECF subfamily